MVRDTITSSFLNGHGLSAGRVLSGLVEYFWIIFSHEALFFYHYSLNSYYISHNIYFTAEGVCIITYFHISGTTKHLSQISTLTAKGCPYAERNYDFFLKHPFQIIFTKVIQNIFQRCSRKSYAYKENSHLYDLKQIIDDDYNINSVQSIKHRIFIEITKFEICILWHKCNIPTEYRQI